MSVLNSLSTAPGAPAVSKEAAQEKLRKAAADLESLFVEQMFQAMREATPEGSLTSGGSGEKMFREMMDRELAQKISSGPGLGIGAMLYRQLAEQAGLSGEIVKPGSAPEAAPKGGHLDANR
jgi:Rod binding domain-containing protein